MKPKSLSFTCSYFLFLSLPFVLIRYHSLYHSLSLVVSLVVTRCHSLSLVVTRFHSLYHSLSFVVTRYTRHCHSLSLVVTRCTTCLSFCKRSFFSLLCVFCSLLSKFEFLFLRAKFLFNVALSPSKKILFICFNENPLKMMKNVFHFILKVLFVLKIFKFLS